ncbi:unnamed protein product [Somion occarium]|uniref:Uncharacterized protein n=1 Tax=Somion occarium TaxID=3059160 RepID=A0ABP1D6M6_9APHY
MILHVMPEQEEPPPPYSLYPPRVEPHSKLDFRNPVLEHLLLSICSDMAVIAVVMTTIFLAYAVNPDLFGPGTHFGLQLVLLMFLMRKGIAAFELIHKMFTAKLAL